MWVRVCFVRITRGCEILSAHTKEKTHRKNNYKWKGRLCRMCTYMHIVHNLVYYYEFSMAISNTCTHPHIAQLKYNVYVCVCVYACRYTDSDACTFFSLSRFDIEHMNENSWLVVQNAETCFNTACVTECSSWFCYTYFNLWFARLFVRSHQLLAIHLILKLTLTHTRPYILLCGDTWPHMWNISHTKIAPHTHPHAQFPLRFRNDSSVFHFQTE